MPLDKSRIEGLRKAGGRWIGRCPACAQADQDRSKQHLILFPDGRFACVVNPGPQGQYHRQEIFRLAGMKEDNNSANNNRPGFDITLL